MKLLRLFLLICFIGLTFSSFAQRLNFGISYDFLGLNYTHFKKDYFFSTLSYNGYYLKKNQTSFVSSYKFGMLVNVDYGRFTYTGSFSIYANSIGDKYAIDYPLADDKYKTYYSAIQYSGTELMPSFSYLFFSKRYMKFYTEAGIGYLMPSGLKENISTEKTMKKVWSDKSELKEQLYLDKPFFNALLGVGTRFTFGTLGFKYYVKLNNIDEVYYSYLTFNITILTNFSKIRRHYVYIN